MREAKGGSIVNMGSINGIQGLPNLVAYAAAKGGLLSMTRTLAGALASDRIRVNYIIPGWIATEGELKIQKGEGRGIEDLEKAGERLPLGRMQTVEDAATPPSIYSATNPHKSLPPSSTSTPAAPCSPFKTICIRVVVPSK